MPDRVLPALPRPSRPGTLVRRCRSGTDPRRSPTADECLWAGADVIRGSAAAPPIHGRSRHLGYLPCPTVRIGKPDESVFVRGVDKGVLGPVNMRS